MKRITQMLAVLVGATLAGCPSPYPMGMLPSSLTDRGRATVYEAIEVHNRAVRLYEQGNTRDAIAVCGRAVEMLTGTLGSMHPYVAVPLRSLAVFHQTLGAYDEAEPLLTHILAIEDKQFGPTDLRLTRPLDELAALYMQWGVYDKAESLYTRALKIREQVLGSQAPGVVDGLNHLAWAFERQGEYGQAEPLYSRALALAQNVLGPTHADVARGLDGLAMVYWAQGTYAQAEPLLMRALEIRTKLVAEVQRFGPTNVDRITRLFSIPWDKPATSAGALGLRFAATAIDTLDATIVRSLSNLDQLHSEVSVNTGTEPLLARTADVYEMAMAGARADQARSIEHLSTLYVTTGDYQRAEPLLIRELGDRESRVGPMHPDVANSLNDLAQLYQTQGAYAKAAPLLRRVLAIRERALGPSHPDIARSLNNLALLYVSLGEYAQAEPLLVRALAIVEQSLGNTHADSARCLNNLAMLHHAQGAFQVAEPLYLRAIEIASMIPGGGYPDSVRYLANLAVLYQALGQYSDAEPLMARAAELRESQLDVELARLSAPRKRALMALLQQETESMVSLHADSTPLSAPALDLALTAVLRRKGLALQSLLANRATLRAHLTPDIRNKLDRLSSANSELTALIRATATSGAAAHASRIAAARSLVETLESDLNAASAALHARSLSVTRASIQAALPPGAALIEFVRYRRFDPRIDQPRWHLPRYAAYVVKQQGQPGWAALGEAAGIDAAVDAVLAEMRPGGNRDAARAALRHLDALVVEPLRGELSDVSHLLVAPDGKLNLVPFDALLDAQGRYELEHRLVSYVASGRDLVQRVPHRAPREPPTVVAAPDYGPGKPFVALGNASSEAGEVLTRLPTARLLSGPLATKAVLAALRGPAVLHVVTHGFFARDVPARSATVPVAPDGPLMSRDSDERGMYVAGLVGPARSPTFGDPADALDRAGLALANANVRADGIVTARELANYDWWGAQLVVLSACETGVGDVPSGEGVYGLRRALALAGAEAQVVSLWSVDDLSTRWLMREFYGELVSGTGRAEALRRAKLSILLQPRFAHPYYWAAFIPAGDWTPLDPNLVQAQQRRSTQAP